MRRCPADWFISSPPYSLADSGQRTGCGEIRAHRGRWRTAADTPSTPSRGPLLATSDGFHDPVSQFDRALLLPHSVVQLTMKSSIEVLPWTTACRPRVPVNRLYQALLLVIVRLLPDEMSITSSLSEATGEVRDDDRSTFRRMSARRACSTGGSQARRPQDQLHNEPTPGANAPHRENGPLLGWE